ncbi:Predicted Fe-Mo cluster-binding protein, NifX family [Propionibacterium cyclohexanicum]|uniref:Predicted Fe-Mo cluster-binding protein, NifX family n=1 Tax=Propionibacterium cyclohexanicum TaxID=64702 RepID=A0A1H9PSQ5_9ACTN|nr:NifB/NifX family molybdenum-iron cluster-binding protein [Propionibacterium cyclohexanicum]SER50789.1 Predicted Fe-Mo cluster-binding protein, NifX family [Propionibacterium cyclohexanicum]
MSDNDETTEPAAPQKWVVAIPVTPDEFVDPRFGRAPDVAIATVEDGAVVDWRVEHVGWDVLHDSSEHGQHHARVVRFMVANHVTAVGATEIGGGMLHSLHKLGPQIVLGVPTTMRARDAVVAIVRRLGEDD